MNKKTLIIMVGYTCNNNCIICSNRPDDKTANDRTTDDIVGDLIKGKKDGYNKVEFTGGEPTVRPDILKLAQYAKDIGYKEIAVSS
ncbi:MAG: radical SAM protein, partial [Minisyncoccales bacterium]